jgi:hypothetical protein
MLTATFVSGCIVIDFNGCSVKAVKGSGKVISEERHVSRFTEVNLKGSGKVTLTRGEKQILEIKTDDNIMPLIKTEVRNGKLIISQDNYNLKPTTLNFFITVENLQGVSISGSGDIEGKSRFSATSFYAEIKGAGDISLELEVGRLDSEISGSGSINLSGNAASLDVSISGSGDIIAYDMSAKDASISIKGSGDCKVNVAERLRAEIKGSGDIFYKGHPQINSTIKGSGSVRSRN